MTHKSYISFYNEIEVIPVSQNTNDIDSHFNRRRHLYEDLGIPGKFLSYAEILELGPGTGDNALFLDQLNPTKLDLVDGSLPSIKAMQQKQSEGLLENANIIQSTIEDYDADKSYDIVFCEGLIPGQRFPNDILLKASRHVRLGGILVITTACYVSLLSEVLRRCLLPLLKERAHSLGTDEIDFCTEFFTSHLQTLNFASRLPKDWVLDCIIQPWVKKYEYNLWDAIQCIGDNFDFYSSNPKFLSDWRWYKSKNTSASGINAIACDQFISTRPIYLSTQSEIRHYAPEFSIKLGKIASEIYDLHNKIRSDNMELKEDFKLLESKLSEVTNELEDQKVSQALQDYITGTQKLMNECATDGFGSFKSFWGRGQSYVSFVRVS